MPKFDWQEVLKLWSDAILASGEYSHLLAANAPAQKWAGFPPATEAAIAKAEQRLKLRLPDSYRRFLKVSNGWWLAGTSGPTRLWAVEEIRPLAEVDPETVAVWTAMEDPPADADPGELPNSHVTAVIQISDDNDGRYLLNPLIKLRGHEWQAAFFAHWVPGAQCYESFGRLMEAKFEAFLAAHPSPAKRRSAPRNLANPPENPIENSREFIDELQGLGFFDFVSDDARANMIRDFHEVSKAFRDNNQRHLEGPFASPGAALLDPKSGRVVDLDMARLAEERGGYAIGAARPLLASAGIELGPIEERTTASSYGVTLEGIPHDYFRLRKGHPALQGGDLEINAARYVLYETAKALNKVFKQRQNSARIATLEEHQAFLSGPTRLAFVLLDDELSYLLMWTPLVHNYCRPMGPDVF
jgi:SMI1 / KNR4 family (SUKH-1)